MAHRIEQILEWFPDTKAEDWHHHKNGGGWVQNTATIDPTVFLDANVIVVDKVIVVGNGAVLGHVWIFSNGCL